MAQVFGTVASWGTQEQDQMLLLLDDMIQQSTGEETTCVKTN